MFGIKLEERDVTKPNFFRSERHPNSRSSRRRPHGVSRRQRRKQFGFESLEDRRVMSADTAALLVPVDTASYSSATPEGQAQILINEIERYYQQTGSLASQAVVNSVPTDPLVGDQWHLINTGQQVGNPDFQSIFGVAGEDINIAPAWQLGYTGAGVTVAVVDSGVETEHPDLAANIDPLLQLDALADDGDANPIIPILPPEFNDPTNAHGTAVAGIIGAVADNDLGGTGVAPGVQLVPVRLIDVGQTEQAFIDTFRYETDQIDITNNSWGPAVVRGLAGPTANETLALRDSIFFGRPDENGEALGVIHVFSAGNSGQSSDTASYNGWVNSRYTIGVTGVDHDGEYNNVDGTVTNYPETSASVLVAAPTGSNTIGIVEDTFPGAIGSGIYTTDVTGEIGYNISPDEDTGQEFDRDFLDDIDYTSGFNGTSAAAPMVSGVIALMLEANPNLSWRDVQEILLRSARQNAEISTQANGIDKATGIEYQNSWIVNQVPLFHDPDFYDPLIDNALQILNPTLDPGLTSLLNGIHYTPTPQVLTNAAGYTVSQGRGTNLDALGYAHGVVDAELAVQLAEQWSTKEQHLPDELTFTTAVNGSPNLPAAEVVDGVSGNLDLIVPGGLFGASGFGAYWAEYLVADPDFTQGFFARGVPVELTVPTPNDMTIETIELTVDIGGDITEFLDNVRIILVSPNGTHSELNHYYLDAGFGNDDIHQVFGSPLLTANGLDSVTSPVIDFFDAGSIDTGITNFTFSTNRSWGERTDDAIIFDPSTAEPAADNFGNSFNAVDPSAGTLATQGWQIYMENYSPVDFTLNNFEVAWHGSPIEPETERIQGLIGIDDNQDDAFNYSRVIQTVAQIDADPTLRLGEIQNIIDPDHETMAANVTVFAHRDVNGNGVLDPSDVLVDQFVTGADGNYYFDLVPDDYIISLDQDSLVDLTAVDDSLTPAGFLLDYQAEWAISEDYFQVWDYDASLEVPIDPVTDAPFPFLDSLGSAVTYGMTNINFLLDPGAPPAQEVVYSGSVFADINGDGIFNGSDVAVPGVGVFGDVNRNGELDAGEILTTTDATGAYTLTVPNTVTTVMNVGVRPPADWTAINPSSAFESFFVSPGDVFTGVDFYIQPPSGTVSGNGSALSGIILGTVFNDANGDTVQQAAEVGVAGQTVYIDMNNSGAVDAGDLVTTTNSNGAYAFANLADGNHVLRVDLAPDSTLQQTFPILGLPQFAVIISGGTATAIDFGLSSGAGAGGGGDIFDFGDLPDSYGTTLAANGPRHPEGIFFLGSLIDSESDGKPDVAARLDDDTDFNDDDGIRLTDVDGLDLAPQELFAGTTNFVVATASRHNMFLQGWIDFDDNGVFDEATERIFTNELLDAGENELEFDVPASVGDTTLYARFRLGEFGLGSTGLAVHGEVEDYAFGVNAATIVTATSGPDFDGDADVDGSDFLAWQRGYGQGAAAVAGDANNDDLVDAVDLDIWTTDYGQGFAPLAALSAGGTDDSGKSGVTQELVSALVSSGEAVDSGILPTFSSSHSAVVTTAFAPRMIQPGFQEDLPPVAVDAMDDQDRAAIASEVARRQDGALRVIRPALQREVRSVEFGNSRIDDQADLGVALRDRALDQIYSRRTDSLKEKHTMRLLDQNTDDALEVALAEEFDWRSDS